MAIKDFVLKEQPLRRGLDYFRYRLLLIVHILLPKRHRVTKLWKVHLFINICFFFGLTVLLLNVHSCLLTSSWLLKLALSIMTQLNHTSPHNVFLHFQSMDSVNNQKANIFKIYILWHKALCHLVKNKPTSINILFYNVKVPAQSYFGSLALSLLDVTITFKHQLLALSIFPQTPFKK